MAMTLAEMKVGMSDKVSRQIVDIFLRESEILQLLPFDNCVSPQGGSTLTYPIPCAKTTDIRVARYSVFLCFIVFGCDLCLVPYTDKACSRCFATVYRNSLLPGGYLSRL